MGGGGVLPGVQLTECSSRSRLWAKTGLKERGDKAPGFFLTARICSSARKAAGEETFLGTQRVRYPKPRLAKALGVGWQRVRHLGDSCPSGSLPSAPPGSLWEADLKPPKEGRPHQWAPFPPHTQTADGTVVGLVAQGVGAGVAQTEVPAGQDESVPQVRETHHTLVAVVAVFIIAGLSGHGGRGGISCESPHLSPSTSPKWPASLMNTANLKPCSKGSRDLSGHPQLPLTGEAEKPESRVSPQNPQGELT